MLRTIATLSLVGALSVPTTANALDLTGVEIGLDTGRTSVADDTFLLFDDYLSAMTSSGLRVTVPLDADDRLAIVGAIAHGARGATTEIYGGSEWEDEYTEFRSAIFNDRLSAGARYTVISNRFKVYGVGQVHGLRSVVRLDDDPVHDDNATQIERAAITAGVSADVGISMDVPLSALTVTPLGWFEMGYNVFLPSQYDDLGKLNLSGLSMRMGVGIKF